MKFRQWTLGLSILLGACLGQANGAEHQDRQEDRNKRIYQFQNGILPGWAHETKGVFYEDLRAGHLKGLLEQAAQVDSEFASGIKVKATSRPKGVLIRFPNSPRSPLCYSVCVVPVKDRFRYFTLEKTLDITQEGWESVVGEWTKESHLNYGERKYTDAESFLRDVDKLLSES